MLNFFLSRVKPLTASGQGRSRCYARLSVLAFSLRPDRRQVRRDPARGYRDSARRHRAHSDRTTRQARSRLAGHTARDLEPLLLKAFASSGPHQSTPR